MAQTITAVYENGMLRPLTPLTLPEHSQVELDVRVIAPESAAARRERARSALTAAGLLAVVAAPDASTGLLTPEQRAALARRLETAGVPPLSAAILEDRDGR